MLENKSSYICKKQIFKYTNKTFYFFIELNDNFKQGTFCRKKFDHRKIILWTFLNDIEFITVVGLVPREKPEAFNSGILRLLFNILFVGNYFVYKFPFELFHIMSCCDLLYLTNRYDFFYLLKVIQIPQVISLVDSWQNITFYL